MFNTLGNIATNPKVGLIVPDFEHGKLLQLTGDATIQWGMDDLGDMTGGTGRYWDFKIARWLLHDSPQRIEWGSVEVSPFTPSGLRVCPPWPE